MMEELKYPIGKYQKPDVFTDDVLDYYISVIEHFPVVLAGEVKDLSDLQLDVPYRPNGWTIRQVVNHCADSHMNAVIRLKWALTEENPIIKPYAEALWAELADGKHMAIEPALTILDGLHARWTILLKSMAASGWKRTFVHPEKGKTLSLEESTGMYAWHCNHHLAHITGLKNRKGW